MTTLVAWAVSSAGSWAASVVSWAVLVPSSTDIPDPDDVKPGWIGATVIVLLGIAVVLLFLSLRRQIRKADRHFAESDRGEGGGGEGGGGEGGGTIGDSDSAAGDTDRPR